MASQTTTTTGGGGCLGAILASVLSVALNHSTGWAIFHFFCSWAYVLYALIVRHSEIIPALRGWFQ